MKRIFKPVLKFFAAVLILFYLAFLILPPFISLNKFKSAILEIVKTNSKLSLEYSKLKIYTTPLLSVGIIARDVNLSFDDGSILFNSPKIKTGVSLPALLFSTVKLAKTYINDPYINLDVVDSSQYRIVKIIEEIINENNAKPKNDNENNQNNFINPDKIKISVPFVKIDNYLAELNDTNTGHSISLMGDKVVLGYFGNKNRVKIKTKVKLLSDEVENICAKINIIAALPEVKTEKDPVSQDEKIKFPYINLIDTYQKYDLKMNLDSDLKIFNTKKGYLAYGYFNVDNFNLKLSNLRLPDSFWHSKFHGKKIEYFSNISVKENEKISFNGAIKHGKNPYLKTHIVSDDIYFSNVLEVLEGLLNSLNIKNNIAQIETKGYLNANTTINTNFKKLNSKGKIIINNASFINPAYNIGIEKFFANLIFDNNALNIKDTSAIINNSKLRAEGFIDNKSNTDIKINIDKLDLNPLYKAFAPNEIKKQYELKSANLALETNINGTFEKLNTNLKLKLDNFALNDNKKTMFISNENASVVFNASRQNLIANIENNGFIFNMPQMKTSVKVNKLVLDADDENINIKPFDIIYSDISKINIKGNILHYLKKPIIDITANASLKTDSIKKTLGKDISPYFISKGEIPVKVFINGDDKKQNIIAQIYADSKNYITPIDIKLLHNSPSLLHMDAEIKANKFKIRDAGFYKKASASFYENPQNNLDGAQKLVDLNSIIENNHINLFKLTLLKELDSSIAIFNKSDFKTSGKLSLYGNLNDLNYSGGLKISGLSIPELLLKVKNADINFLSKTMELKANEINLNGSKLNTSLKMSLKPSKVLKVFDINISSDFVDADKAMIVSEQALKYIPSSSSSSKTSQNQAMPLDCDGRFDIKKIKSGNIELFSTKGLLGVKNNDLIIKNLSTNVFKGSIAGDIKMNLVNGLMNVKVSGSNIDFDNMLNNAAGMKDTISGILQFKTNIAFKGNTYIEQMKSMRGSIDFQAKDGQYGPFSKLENFFLAQNVRENPVFKNTIGVILTPLATIDSSHYELLKGKITFKNGFAYFNPITSQGDILCVLINGNMNLVENNINSNVRVRLASNVSDKLGPLSMVNPVNLVKNTSGLNVATARLFTLFSQAVNEKEYALIPDFSSKHSDSNATKFQITLLGNVEKPLTLVKSFKWLVLEEDMEKAKEFSAKYIKEQEELSKQILIDKLQKDYEKNNKVKVGIEKVLKRDTTAPEVKKVLVDEVIKAKNLTVKNFQGNIQNKTDALKETLKDKLNDAKKQDVSE